MNSSWTLLMTLTSKSEFMGPLFSLWQCLKTVRFVGKSLPYLGHREDQRNHGPLKTRKDRRKTTTKHHCVLLILKTTTETCGAGLSLGEARSSTPHEELNGTTWTWLRFAVVCPEAAAVHWGRPHSRGVYLSTYKHGFTSCTQDLWDAQVVSTGD